MGDSFLALHVGNRSARPLDVFVDALVRAVTADGAFVVAEGERTDREVVLVMESRWVSVQDSAFARRYVTPEELGRAVSAAVGEPAMTTWLHDSGHVGSELIVGGDTLDRLVVSHVSDRARRPEVSKWRHVLVDGVAPSSLDSAWERTLENPVTFLDELASLVGCPPAHLTARVFEERPAARVRVLRFRFVGDQPAPELEAAPPALTVGAPHATGRITRVDDVVRYTWSGENRGGRAHGVSVSVGGEALARGLVEITAMDLSAGGSRQQAKLLVDGAAVEARFPDAVIETAPGRAEGARVWDRRARLRGSFRIDVVARAKTAGSGMLTMGGQVTAERMVEIEEALPWRPLRAPASPDLRALEAFNRTDRLVAVLVYGRPQAEVASHAHEMLAAVLDAAPSAAEERSYDVAPPLPAPLRSDEGWASLARAMATEASVSVTTAAHGLRLGAPPPTHPGESMQPTLVLWIDIEGWTVAAVDAFRKKTTELFTRAFAELDAVQGFLARSGGEPTLVRTPYEAVVGIQGKHLLTHAWSTQFLRGVGDELTWLGPKLLERLDETTVKALSDATVVERVHGGLRIQGSRAAMPTVEQALADLLPDESQLSAITRT